MKPCKTCGRQIRYCVMRVSFNRKRGVACWLQPADGENCPCLKDWCWTKWRSDKSRPSITDRKLAEWETLHS